MLLFLIGSSSAWLRLLRMSSLLFLTLQNTSLVLVMRYARTRSGDMFLATTAVVVAEVFKVAVCLVVILYEHKFNVRDFLSYLFAVSLCMISCLISFLF